MAKYPTKKFDCWQLAKEIQLKTFDGVMTAREEGKILLAGSSSFQGCFLTGLMGPDGFAFLPISTYEGSTSDLKDWNEAQVLNRIDSFMESLGLSRLED